MHQSVVFYKLGYIECGNLIRWYQEPQKSPKTSRIQCFKPSSIKHNLFWSLVFTITEFHWKDKTKFWKGTVFFYHEQLGTYDCFHFFFLQALMYSSDMPLTQQFTLSAIPHLGENLISVRMKTITLKGSTGIHILLSTKFECILSRKKNHLQNSKTCFLNGKIIHTILG